MLINVRSKIWIRSMEDTPKKQCKDLKNMEFLKVALSVNLSEVAFQNQTGV